MNTKRTWVVGVIAALLLVIVAPVLLTRLRDEQPRQLTGIALDEISVQPVRFRNDSAQLDLAGMLLVPAGDGPFPAVVMIHGSGTSRRDNGWYLTVAESLRQQGILVLLPDKRGSEQSAGDWRTASFESLAGDSVAAVQYLKRSDLPISKIGIIGMSQGGHIAPLVADQSDDVRFLINVVGSTVPLAESLVYEETNNLRELGFLPGVSDCLARLSSLYVRRIGQSRFWNAVDGYDPAQYWLRLEVPALALFGSDDQNVDSQRSASVLRAIGNPRVKTVILTGSGHALEDPVGCGDRVFRQEAIDLMVDFIKPSRPAD